MSARIQPLEVNQAEGRTQELFQGIKAKFGKVPNMMRTMGHAPALLDGYLNLNATLSSGVVPPQVREQVNLAVSQANSCEYCVSAHTLLGKHAGLSAEQMFDARRGRSAGRGQPCDDFVDPLTRREQRVVRSRALYS